MSKDLTFSFLFQGSLGLVSQTGNSCSPSVRCRKFGVLAGPENKNASNSGLSVKDRVVPLNKHVTKGVEFDGACLNFQPLAVSSLCQLSKTSCFVLQNEFSRQQPDSGKSTDVLTVQVAIKKFCKQHKDIIFKVNTLVALTKTMTPQVLMNEFFLDHL